MFKAIIIEDDPMVASINHQYLGTNSSIEILGEFRNGRDALEYIEQHAVDLAIVDYYMPVMDGMKFIRKCHEKSLKLDVIMITASNNAHDISEFMQLGIVDYLVKPFTYQRFCQAIEKYVSMKHLVRQKEELNQMDIDRLFLANKAVQETPALEKGLQEQTLSIIRAYLKEHKGIFFSSNEIASEVNLSRITVRRYMNYLVENREISSKIDYSTGGRPSIKYRM